MTRAQLAVLVVLLAGCSSAGPGRYQVDGEVSFNGQPVPEGSVLFEPDAARGNRGPGVVALIHHGRFCTEPNRGVVGGPHLVRVVGYNGQADPRMETPLGQALFEEQLLTLDLPHKHCTQHLNVAAR
jgi:hypothetical protein